jgi:hypothetical protein
VGVLVQDVPEVQLKINGFYKEPKPLMMFKASTCTEPSVNIKGGPVNMHTSGRWRAAGFLIGTAFNFHSQSIAILLSQHVIFQSHAHSPMTLFLAPFLAFCSSGGFREDIIPGNSFEPGHLPHPAAA